MNEFIWPVRVYYEDTDSGGVVYHANYLNFMERARTEWLRSLHLEQDEISAEYGVLFVVHSLSVNYLKPALFNEALLVKTKIQKLSRASIIYEQYIVRRAEQGDTEQVLTTAVVKIVSVSKPLAKPVRIPKEIYELFSSLTQ